MFKWFKREERNYPVVISSPNFVKPVNISFDGIHCDWGGRGSRMMRAYYNWALWVLNDYNEDFEGYMKAVGVLSNPGITDADYCSTITLAIAKEHWFGSNESIPDSVSNIEV